MSAIESSTITARAWLSRLLGRTFGGARDLYEVLGYTRELRAEHCYAMYLRNEIASRIVRAYPQATWRVPPIVRDEAGGTAEESAFVEAWQDLYERMRLSHYFERTDRLASIGHYGVLHVGINDGKPQSEPLERGSYDILYLSPYAEMHCTVHRWDMDPASPRFGLPDLYTLQTGGGLTHTDRAATKSILVHHSRLIHVAETLDEDEVFGVPRLKPVFNRLQDAEKVVGGSAETFWLAGNRGLAMIANADANLDEAAKAEAKKQAEEYQHQLRRILTVQGMDVQNLGSDTPDPSSNVDTLMSLIAGGVGIPKRILLGNEAGELASSQDETNWNSRVEERREQFAGPTIVRPFVRMMLDTGNLPEPQGDWWCDWDKSDGLSEKDRAEILHRKMQALQAYGAAIGGEEIIPRTEFRALAGMEPEPEGGFVEVEDDSEALDGDL